MHVESRRVPFSPQEMFDLVADVESYAQFVPHVIASRIVTSDGNTVHVEMVLGFGILRRRIRSTGVLSPPRRIEITSHDPPLRRLTLCWSFRPTHNGETIVELRADFALRAPIWQRLLAPYFKAEVAAMADAFERRARDLSKRAAKP